MQILHALLGFLQPAPYKDEIEDKNVVKKEYTYWRYRVFFSMFFGYALYYFTRKGLSIIMPTLIADLQFDKSDLGLVSSVWAISYGVSKFVSGVLGDKSNARSFMAFGLAITGLCNILFGLSSSLSFFMLCWALNGWFQGFGWPSCARLLTHWYSQSERGKWWGFWNASHNIGGAIIPLATAYFAYHYGWRTAMILPGVISMAMSVVLLKCLCDTPQSLGLPPIEKHRNDYPSGQAKNEKEHELTVKEILFSYVLNNPYIWLLAVGYFFVYIVRHAVGEWSLLYLVEAKNYTTIEASRVVFWFDIGGMFGGLAAGWMSDSLFSSKRAPSMIFFAIATAAVLLGMWFCPVEVYILDAILLFAAGFFIFGPQMLIGMMAAEIAHKKAAATASGFTGCAAYLGAAVAGFPLGYLLQNFGWTAFFLALSVCGSIAALLLMPLWNIKSREDCLAKEEPASISETIEQEVDARPAS